MLISGEQLDVTACWVVSGTLRLRREIVTEIKTVEVTVRKEILTVDYTDLREPGLANGAPPDALAVPDPPVDRAPISIVLHEEVPHITLQSTPYEVVTATFTRSITEHLAHADLRQEQIVVETPRQDNGS